MAHIALKHAYHTLHRLILALLLASCAMALPVVAQDRLTALAGNGSVMLRSPAGETLVSINPDRPLVPASLLKIPLAHVALSLLGEDFRFQTHFYRNASGDLLIRGLGDPFLVSEDIALIADTLARQGLQQVRRVMMDDTAFEPNPDLPVETGSNQPYAARTSALAVNFNTVNLAWAADGSLVSGEPQTPLTSFAHELAQSLSPGEPQRINLGENPQAGLRQGQQLFIHFLAESGIDVSDDNFYAEELASGWSLFYAHESSRTLSDILDGLLRYSNNFIANQLFLTLGAQQNGYPVSVTTARLVLQQQLAKLYGENFGTDSATLLMIEGSGLSRSQLSTATSMMHILDVFKPYAQLLPDIDGVLRKSGTLTGVYNFAGYIRGTDGLYPFVIMTNQSNNNRAEILRILRTRI